MGSLRDELMKIRAKRGDLTPRIVWEEAKDKKHPLHDKVFDVPRSEAADRYYINNAARLLRVTFRADLDGKPADLRAFWVQKGTDDHPESSYVPIEEVIVDPISSEIMLRQMMREWKRFKNRYQNMAEFREIIRSDPDFFPADPDESYGDEGNGSEG